MDDLMLQTCIYQPAIRMAAEAAEKRAAETSAEPTSEQDAPKPPSDKAENFRIGIFAAAVVFAVAFLVYAVRAEYKPNYSLNETQKMRLQLKQAQAVNLKVQYDQVQSQLTAKLQEFDAECSKIKKENNLPDTAVCDINNPGVVKPPEQVKK